MRRGVGIVALRALSAVIVVACALPAGAAGEQASQPTGSAAGGLDVGKYHACALLSSASVRCWGYGGYRALGYANTTTIGDDETPAAAGPVDLGAGHTATALSAGSLHTCALLDDGTVRCWGFGGDGQLGDVGMNSFGDEAPGSVGPVDLGAGRTAKAIAAGAAHTCAVLDDDTVSCWGFGGNGRLGYGNVDSIGDNETPGSAGPVYLGDGRTATAITAGDAHTCALLDDGTGICWGYAGDGELGTGNRLSVGDNETPASFGQDNPGKVTLGYKRTAVAISAGAFHTCALLDNGSVRCWGLGANGRLGYGNEDNIGDNEAVTYVTPVDLGAGRTAVAISAGGAHTCAVLDNGSVRCWGYGGDGQLGYGNESSIGDDETPGSVGTVDLGAGRTAVAISAGDASTCARLDDGSVRCWGSGVYGRLGSCTQSSVGDDETPGSVAPLHLEPGDRGAGCPSAASSPVLSAPPPPLPPALPPDGAAAALAAQQLRATALRACLRRAATHARRLRRRARQLSDPARKIALRRLARRTRRGRGHCLHRYGRTPGRVSALGARAVGARVVRLTFRAPGTDHAHPPAAQRYLIKQSRRPMRTQGDFRAAHALCHGHCVVDVTRVGAAVKQRVTGLTGNRTYYYAIIARDNVSARPGPRSKSVRVRTG